METDLRILTIEQLNEFYKKANEELKTALLNGLSWKEVKSKRDIIIEISKEIHKKKESFSSSAE
jgi:hypothetical protein